MLEHPSGQNGPFYNREKPGMEGTLDCKLYWYAKFTKLFSHFSWLKKSWVLFVKSLLIGINWQGQNFSTDDLIPG